MYSYSMHDTTFAQGGLFACCRATIGSVDPDHHVVDGDELHCECGTPIVLDDRVWRWKRD
jgi:hypothetical protein